MAIQREEDVLVKECRIVVRRLHVMRSEGGIEREGARDVPWRRPSEGLAGHGRERANDPGVVATGAFGDVRREEPA